MVYLTNILTQIEPEVTPTNLYKMHLVKAEKDSSGKGTAWAHK